MIFSIVISQCSKLINLFSQKQPQQNLFLLAHMKSLMKTFDTNCCNERKSLNKNRSEKELSFDIRAKSFSILDIKHIRKNYKKNHQIQRSPSQERQSNLKVRGNLSKKISDRPKFIEVQVSAQKRKSLLSSYCQKVSKISQEQFSFDYQVNPRKLQQESLNKRLKSKQRSQNSIKRQKLSITYGKSSLNNFRGIRSKNTQGYLKIDIKRDQIKEFHQQGIHPVLNMETQKRTYTNFETNTRKMGHELTYFIDKPLIMREKEYEKFSLCNTTTENSQNSSSLNAVNPLQNVRYTVSSKVSNLQESYGSMKKEDGMMKQHPIDNRICELLHDDKENDTSVGNKISKIKGIEKSRHFFKKQQLRTNDREEKVTDSILYYQDLSPQNRLNLSVNTLQIIEEPSVNLFLLKQQIRTLKQEYDQLKEQESELLNKMNQNENQFQTKYQHLISNKVQCQIQQRKRNEEINEIKKLLDQRVKQIHENQFTVN